MPSPANHRNNFQQGFWLRPKEVCKRGSPCCIPQNAKNTLLHFRPHLAVGLDMAVKEFSTNRLNRSLPSSPISNLCSLAHDAPVLVKELALSFRIKTQKCLPFFNSRRFLPSVVRQLFCIVSSRRKILTEKRPSDRFDLSSSGWFLRFNQTSFRKVHPIF